MSATQHNSRATRRPIKGNTLTIYKRDEYLDRDWSFNPELATNRRTRKPRRPAKDEWLPLETYWKLCDLGLNTVTVNDIVLELRRRGVSI